MLEMALMSTDATKTTARETRGRRPVRCILALSAVLTMVAAGGAQAANKYAGEFLTHGVGARALGMGSAFVAVADDVTAGYWNPAGVADAKGRSVQLMHSETFGDVVNYDTGAYVHPLSNDAALAVTFVRLAVDDIPFTDFESDEERIYYDESRITWESDSEEAALVTYARRTSDRLRLGGNLKLIRKLIGNYSCYGLGFDLGAKYDVTPGTTLGVEHPGCDDDLPGLGHEGAGAHHAHREGGSGLFATRIVDGRRRDRGGGRRREVREQASGG